MKNLIKFKNYGVIHDRDETHETVGVYFKGQYKGYILVSTLVTPYESIVTSSYNRFPERKINLRNVETIEDAEKRVREVYFPERKW